MRGYGFVGWPTDSFIYLLLQYLRDLYQTPALKKTVKWDHLKLMLVNFFPDATASELSIDYDAAHDRAN